MSNPTGLCLCGCGQKTGIAKSNRPQFGWVIGEPVSYVMNHSKRKWRNRFTVDPVSGCHNWDGPITRKGYGGIQGTLAHAFFYRMLVGEVPKGYTIDHLCRNRRCVNVEHLEAVPHIVNCHRGEQTKLTDEQVEEIRSRPFSGYRHNVRLAAEFKVSIGEIEGIRYGGSRTKKEPANFVSKLSRVAI
jgi:HNH endonuclease